MEEIKNRSRAMVLMSGGIDSTTCLFIAKERMDKEGGTVEAISMDYGQRHSKEMAQAKIICDMHEIKHTILDVKGFTSGTMLTDPDQELPDASYDDLEPGVSPTYVPFRNGFMLSRLTAYAQEYVMKTNKELEVSSNLIPPINLEDLVTIYFGAHAEDAQNWAYPDCTPEFIGAMANAIYIGTYRSVRLSAPLMSLRKDQIIEWGTKLGVPYYLTWSCYDGQEAHCGRCPTCRSRKDAFLIANVKDPTVYADRIAA